MFVEAHLFLPCDIPSSPLLAALVNIAFSGNLGSPGMGKLEIPNVYISFWPAFFDVHCEEKMPNNKISVFRV